MGTRSYREGAFFLVTSHDRFRDFRNPPKGPPGAAARVAVFHSAAPHAVPSNPNRQHGRDGRGHLVLWRRCRHRPSGQPPRVRGGQRGPNLRPTGLSFPSARARKDTGVGSDHAGIGINRVIVPNSGRWPQRLHCRVRGRGGSDWMGRTRRIHPGPSWILLCSSPAVAGFLTIGVVDLRRRRPLANPPPLVLIRHP